MANDREFTPEEIKEGKAVAAIGYLLILFFIPLVVKPQNRFCRAHGKQAMVLFMAGALAGTFSCFVVQIVALVKTVQGEFWKIPAVGDLASRINL